MADMADALAKAGLISQKDADRVEHEKRKAASNQVKEKKSRSSAPQREISTQYEKFDEMWSNQKSRGFMKHLLWSFVPATKVDKIFENEEKYDRKCCICQVGTMSINDVMKCMREDAGKSLFEKAEFIVAHHDEEKDPEYEEKYAAFMEQQGKKVFGGKMLAFVGVDSTKTFCQPCYQEFYDWIMTRLTMGDREINGIIGKLRRSTHKKREDNGV